jgi:ATP-dependent exoDNAse (exonuclease V) beta subunit
VSEEEGAEAVRLLTIHGAKGLEFKVVVVADAGRDTGGAPRADEILARADGRFGFKAVHPTTGRKQAVFDYEGVRRAGQEDEAAERLRLYYVAMTRAVDRLLVSGALGESRDTPIGWVLSKLDCEEELASGGELLELQRGGASFLVRLDRPAEPVAEPAVAEQAEDEPAAELQLALFSELPSTPRVRGWRLPDLEALPAPPVHRVRQLSYSALALFERCSYRYYAERVAGLRELRGSRVGPADEGLSATEIGDAVHRLLEETDLRTLELPSLEVVRGWYPAVTDEELERIGALAAAYCGSELARRVAALEGARPEVPFAFEHDEVLLHGRLDILQRAAGRALIVDFKTNVLGDRSPAEVVAADYVLQRLVYALACLRAGDGAVEVVYVFLERPEEVVSATFTAADRGTLEAELTAAIDRINEGRFVPTPGEFTCSGCPALDLVCAGPRNRTLLAGQEAVVGG